MQSASAVARAAENASISSEPAFGMPPLKREKGVTRFVQLPHVGLRCCHLVLSLAVTKRLFS
jgi:hypothetical protein